MSKISLAPDASGTGIFTIASPNSNTNRTLTLPDDTGTIVTNSGNQAGSFTTLNTSGAVVFNDAGADVDFRVEGDADDNLLRVDAGNDRVGVGTGLPSYKLDVAQANPTRGIVARIQNSAGGSLTGTQVAFNQNTIDDWAIGMPAGVSAFVFWASRTSVSDGTEIARFTNTGNLLVGVTSGSYNKIGKSVTNDAGNGVFEVFGGSQATSIICYGVSAYGANVANTSCGVGKDNTTSRSINAGGTVNASGTDYAEYMIKAGEFELAKGDICGVNSDGKLTNVFADAVAFVVKSTNPSYVGGDTWGNEDAVGKKPVAPIQQAAEVDEEGNETQAAETDEAFAARQAQYETDLAEFEAKLEAERQKVDRIAFSGQVPVNVTGATAGQYIVPVENNGGITGVAVNEADMTLAQYMKAVGKVIAIEADGRAKIIVKVA